MPRFALVWLAPLLLVPSCASAPLEVVVDSDPEADFSAIERVGFLEGPGAGPAPHEEPLHRHLVRRTLRERLESRGYRFAEPADFLVRFEVGSLRQVPAGDGVRVARGLELEFLDPHTRRVLWQGWAGETREDTLDPEAEVRTAVRLLLDRFPKATED